MEAQMGALTAQDLPKIKFTRKRRKELGYVEVRGPSGISFKITGLYIAGRRVRRFFRTAQEAEMFLEAQALKEETLGIRARAVDGRLHEQAAEAELLLRPFGTCLLDAVREWIRASNALRGFRGVSIVSAAETEAKRLAERAQSWTFAQAKEAWLVSRREKGRTDVYLNDANKRLARFAQIYGAISLADISAEAIERWLNELGLSPQSRMNFRSVLRAVFNFAVRKNKAPRNPVVDVEAERVVRDEPGILTPAELRRLLAVLPADTIPFVTIQAFAGLRPTEVRRLDWRSVNLATGRIRLERKSTKTKRARVVDMPENLKAWLQLLAKEAGPVVELADFTIREKRLKLARKKAKIRRWPHDCLRHSAASYLLALHENVAWVALQLGHDQEVMHEHYKAIVEKEAAQEWFGILPGKTAENIIAFQPSATNAAKQSAR